MENLINGIKRLNVERFRYDGIIVNWDINGARNILLRAMRDGSATGCDSPSMTCNKATFGRIC